MIYDSPVVKTTCIASREDLLLPASSVSSGIIIDYIYPYPYLWYHISTNINSIVGS